MMQSKVISLTCRTLLTEMVQGLRIMHEHGYVHRDVSTGNIIFHDGNGKIADLEYAKEIGRGEAHEVRTVWTSSHHRNARSTYIHG
jgi:serine/threonine protein kinase